MSQVPQSLSSLNLNLGQLEMEAEVVHLLAQLDLDGSPDVKHNEATSEQVSQLHECAVQETHWLQDHHLETYLTAATLVPEPPNMRHQDALFRPSQDIYKASAQQMPDALQPLAATDAVSSMQSVLSQALHAKAFRPSPTFGRMPPQDR